MTEQLHSQIIHSTYPGVVDTVIAFIVLIFVFGVTSLLIKNKYDSARKRKQLQIRTFYILMFVFLFVLARIWVDGFTHLLAVLGLLSAAIVVTNKESIMNLVGWLIINWRSLFSEDDLVQIQQYKGYVKHIGIFFFTLTEASALSSSTITGRTIRIPNGLVTTNPVIKFSGDSHLLEQNITIVITEDSSLNRAITFITKLVADILKHQYPSISNFQGNKARQQLVEMKRIHFNPEIFVRAKLDKPCGTELVIRYFCFAKDADEIQQNIWKLLLEKLNNETSFRLAYT